MYAAVELEGQDHVGHGGRLLEKGSHVLDAMPRQPAPDLSDVEGEVWVVLFSMD